MADFAPSYLANLMSDWRETFFKNVALYYQKKNPSLEFSPTAENKTFSQYLM